MRRGKQHGDRTVSDSRRAMAGAGRKPAKSRPQNHAAPAAYAASHKTAMWVAVVMAALVLFIYDPVRHYGFLSYDDPEYVSENAHIISGVTVRGVAWAFTTGHASNWHPVTWLSHMLDVQMHGMNAGRHHITNLVLHLANTLLLFGILYRITGAWRRSAVVAALFAAHPLHVESVAWIAERKDVLSTLFWMLTMHAYVSYVVKPRLGRYLAVVAAFVLGLMSKPMLVTLPFVLLLLDIWPLGRIRLEAGQQKVWLRMFREKIPLFVLAAASSVMTVMAQWRGGAVQSFEAIPLYQRAANALFSYVAYLVQTLWPANLAAYYPYRPLSLWLTAASALVLIAVSVIVIRFSRSCAGLFAGWFWYLITLVPVIGLVQVGGQARADRYTYIPLIGVFVAGAWGIAAIIERRRSRRAVSLAAACILVCALAAGARSQVRYWESDLALWQRAVQMTADNYFARTNLGFALIDRGEVAAAIEQYTEALRIKPNSAETHNALGTALLKQGRPDAAMEQFVTALRIKPGFAEAHSNRGMVLAQLGNAEEAFSEFRKALEISPENPEIQYNFGFALATQGKLNEAMSYFQKALTGRPDYADAYFQMGNAYAGKEMLSEAASEYAKALRIKPDYADAHNNLGVVLLELDRHDEAVAHFTEALRINPNDVRARENLNRALAKEQYKSAAP
jgi:tetratricopeptide (TPR) repeat protein